MNTQYVRKIAISKQLGEMMENICKYSPSDTVARGGSIEPDEAALFQFSDEISRFAKLHYKNSLTIRDIGNAIKFYVGHVFSDGSNTGTWGVRISDLYDLIKILEIPDFELISYESEIMWHGSPIKVISFHPESNWMAVKFQNTSSEGEIHEWENCIYWRDLEILKK